jgi:hypothetical protein
VHVFGREQRSFGSSEYPHILTLGKLQDLADISDGMMKGNVAGDGTDSKNFDRGEPRALKMAPPSSGPGSVSIITCFFINLRHEHL